MTHRSYINEAAGQVSLSNERLEFLGDAVLGLVVAEKLYSDYPDFHEGDLTRVRSALVRTDMLAEVARNINLGDYLLIGRGEEESGGRDRRRNLAGAMEALIGAVYLDNGFEAAADLVLRILGNEFQSAIERKSRKNPKSRLQEMMQASGRHAPAYQVVNATGPDHNKLFLVEVFVEGVWLGCGIGSSKQMAEQEAARAAIESLEEREDLV